EGSAWPSFLRRSKSRDGGRRTQPTPSRPPPAPHQGDFPIAEGAAAAEPSEGGGGSSAAGEEASAGAVAERPAGQRTWTLWRREPPAGRGASPSTSAVQVSLPGRPAGDDGSQPSKDAADPGNGSEEDCAGDKDGLAPDEREGDSLQCEAMPATGDGAGESVTQFPAVIDTELGLMLDAPGIDDTMLRFSDDEAGRRVALALAASGVTHVKFLVFESLANDAMQLRSTLEKLFRAFGAAVAPATLVLATKADMLTRAVIICAGGRAVLRVASATDAMAPKRAAVALEIRFLCKLLLHQ
ncbi:unnamed protein product, partial [Prorocentrum cordatum]